MSIELLTQIPHDENDLLQFSLDELAKIGAKQILSDALRLEVQEYLQRHRHHVDDNGHPLVVGHGKGKKHKITVGSTIARCHATSKTEIFNSKN